MTSFNGPCPGFMLIIVSGVLSFGQPVYPPDATAFLRSLESCEDKVGDFFTFKYALRYPGLRSHVAGAVQVHSLRLENSKISQR